MSIPNLNHRLNGYTVAGPELHDVKSTADHFYQANKKPR